MQESEKELSIGGLPTDIKDGANTVDSYDPGILSEFKMKDIKITGPIRLFMLLSCLIGIGFSAYSSSLFGIVIWSVIMVFIMDLMGMLDFLNEWLKDVSRPKGGYENVE